jgi:hypothetical protein
MANEIIGDLSYLVMGDEASWGVGGAGSGAGYGTGSGGYAGTYYYIPVTNYGVRFKSENRQANPFLGIFQRANSKNWRGMPSGQMVLPLYGFQATSMGTSIMQYLMDWAFQQHETLALPSKLVQWAEGPNVANKQHNGLRVNQATFAGSADDGQVTLTLDLMGQSESGNTVVTALPAVPNNKNKIVQCEFSDCTFKIAGSTVLLSSFQVQISNGLKVEYLNSYTPSLLLKTQRVVTVTMMPIKNSDTYDAYNRAQTMTEFTGEIDFKGLHNGTGTGGTNWTTGAMTFARLSFLNADNQGGKEDIWKQPIQMVALKPDTSTNDLAIAWSESA